MRLKDGYILRKVAGQYIAVPFGAHAMKSRRIHALSESAALLWSAMEEDISVDGLVRVVAEAYPGLPEERLRGDIMQFVDQLNAEGLIVFDDTAVSSD